MAVVLPVLQQAPAVAPAVVEHISTQILASIHVQMGYMVTPPIGNAMVRNSQVPAF